jgi:flavin reductase (DIM6/NTAB) family NADH-FMN oxidoreductase RutF
MEKVELGPKLRFDFPTGMVVISCVAPAALPNLMTAGAISHACIDPPMLGVAIGHSRHTYELMSRADGFVVNAASSDQAHLVDLCGGVSGRDVDKYAYCGLTPLPSLRIASPGVTEFPLNIECALRTSVVLGSHTYFFGEIVAVRCARDVLAPDGLVDARKLRPVVGFLDSYWTLGEPVLKFGEAERLSRD